MANSLAERIISTQIDPSPFIDKAYAAIKLQPYGTDEEHARRIGVEVMDVRHAKRILEAENFRPLAFRAKRRKDVTPPKAKLTFERSRELRDSVKAYIIANPKATKLQTVAELGVSRSIVEYARCQLIQDGLRTKIDPSQSRAARIRRSAATNRGGLSSGARQPSRRHVLPPH